MNCRFTPSDLVNISEEYLIRYTVAIVRTKGLSLRMLVPMLRNVLYLFSGNALSAFLNLLMGYLILRYLSAEEYGRYGVVVDFLNMLALMLGSFFVNALQRYVALYRAGREKERLSGILKTALLYASVASFLILLPSLLAPDLVASLFLRDVAYAPFVRLYALAVPFVILSAYLSSFMKGMGMFARVGIFDLTMPTVVRATVLTVGLPSFPGHGPEVATLSSVFKFLSNFLLNSLASWRAILRYLRLKESRYEIGEWVRYSIFVWGRYALSILASNVKSVIVGSLKGATAGGVFKVSFLLLPPVYMLETSLVSVLFTRLSGEIGRGKDVSGKVREYAAYISAAELALGTLLVLIGPTILSFFGKGYDAATPLLSVILLAYVLNALSSVHKVFLLSVGRSDLILLIHGVSAAVSVGSGILLVRLFGAVGGAYAFVAEVIAGTITAFSLYWKVAGRLPLDKKTAAVSLFAVAAALALTLLRGE